MAWDTWTGNQFTTGLTPVVTKIEAMLTAHVAWEYVETVTEYYDEEDPVTLTDFHSATYTCRIWKCLGTQNGTGKDFFVAIITSLEEWRHEDTGAFVANHDENCLWILPFEEWNTTTHMMRRPAGCEWNRYGPTGTTDYFLDPDLDYAPHGDTWFKIIEPRLADDGLSWGTWGWWDRDLASIPAGNIRRGHDIWTEWYEPFLEFDGHSYQQNYSLPAPYKPYMWYEPDPVDLTVWIRVSKQGILIYGMNADETYAGTLSGGYAGLGIEDHRPDELKSGFPLIYSQYFWLGEFGSGVPMSRPIEYGDKVAIDYFWPAYYDDYEFGVFADRDHSPYNAVEAWAVMPARVALDPVTTGSWEPLLYDPGVIIPPGTD
jgi:hypothetical protein